MIGMVCIAQHQSEVIVEIYKDVLTPEEQKYVIEKTLYSDRWAFSQKSDGSKPDNYTFWQLYLDNDDFFRVTFFNKIKKLTGKDYDIERIYANGQTYGLPGAFHRDTKEPNGRTFLYYVNPEWKADWGGETIFYTEKTPTIIFPVPNSAVLFDGNIPHFGKDPSRKTNILRVTLAFKLFEK